MYSKKNDIDKLSYLKGYLDVFSMLNSFINDGKTYNIEVLPKVEGNIEKTLRNLYGVKNWIITEENIGKNWSEYLCNDIRSFFDQILVELFIKTNPSEIRDSNGKYLDSANKKIDEIRKDPHFNIGFVIGEFVSTLESLADDNSSLIKVNIDWRPEHYEYEGFYECYANDYIIEKRNHYIYLHFGVSD